MSFHMPIVSIGQKKVVEPMTLFYRESTNSSSRKVHSKKRVHKVQRKEITMLGLVV
jgi:hypothetical protein